MVFKRVNKLTTTSAAREVNSLTAPQIKQRHCRMHSRQSEVRVQNVCGSYEFASKRARGAASSIVGHEF